MISDFRPPIVTEDSSPAPGSLTVFQSSRGARPQDASEARNRVSSARCYFDMDKQVMLRPDSGVADIEARLDRPVVSWIQFSSTGFRRIC